MEEVTQSGMVLGLSLQLFSRMVSGKYCPHQRRWRHYKIVTSGKGSAGSESRGSRLRWADFGAKPMTGNGQNWVLPSENKSSGGMRYMPAVADEQDDVFGFFRMPAGGIDRCSHC